MVYEEPPSRGEGLPLTRNPRTGGQLPTLYLEIVPEQARAGVVAAAPALERRARCDLGTRPRESKVPPLHLHNPNSCRVAKTGSARMGSEDGTDGSHCRHRCQQGMAKYRALARESRTAGRPRRRRIRPAGRVVNSFTGLQTSAITYADFGNEVLAAKPCRAGRGCAFSAGPPALSGASLIKARGRNRQRQAI
jgi:hypothetical protein